MAHCGHDCGKSKSICADLLTLYHFKSYFVYEAKKINFNCLFKIKINPQ